MKRPATLIALAALALSGCTSAHTATTAAAPASWAALPSAAPSTSLADSPMQDWCVDLTGGYNHMQTVIEDLKAVRTDYGNYQYGSAANDGTKLLQDAAEARLHPPPGTKRQRKDYVAYMKVAGLMGGDFAQGDFNLGFDEASQAAPYHSVMQQIADQCAAAWGGSPAA